MSFDIERNLRDKGINVPEPGKAVASYEPAVTSGSQLFVSGQLPLKDGRLVAAGIVGIDVDLPTAQTAARKSALNVLAQIRASLGSLNRIHRLVKITVFVASSYDFTEQHIVANAASAFFLDALGDAGKHVRSAIGVTALPMNAPVEIECIVEFE